MFTQTTKQQIKWQDLKVRSEVDLVFEIARQKGWKDCEIFGHGEMIAQPLESMGWKLIPADVYEYSIPAEGVERVLQAINAGVRIQGIIIADDGRRTVPAPLPAPAPTPTPAPATPAAPARPPISLPSAETVAIFICKVLFGLIMVAGAIAFSPFIILFGFLPSVLGAGGGGGEDTDYDPKLVLLVDDGNGGTAWVSILTWYD